MCLKPEGGGQAALTLGAAEGSLAHSSLTHLGGAFGGAQRAAEDRLAQLQSLPHLGGGRRERRGRERVDYVPARTYAGTSHAGRPNTRRGRRCGRGAPREAQAPQRVGASVAGGVWAPQTRVGASVAGGVWAPQTRVGASSAEAREAQHVA